MTKEELAGCQRVLEPFGGDVDRKARALLAEIESLTKRAEAAEQECERCSTCDGTGDVHRIDGEWLGECDQCNANALSKALLLNVELTAKLEAAELNARRYELFKERMNIYPGGDFTHVMFKFRDGLGIDAAIDELAEGGAE